MFVFVIRGNIFDIDVVGGGGGGNAKGNGNLMGGKEVEWRRGREVQRGVHKGHVCVF